MTRRATQGDQEFGSDSFLDIIANIVGILIILIVIAGVKVARQPDSVSDGADTFEGATAEAESEVAVDQPEMIGMPDWDAVPSRNLVLDSIPLDRSVELKRSQALKQKVSRDEAQLKAYLVSLQKVPRTEGRDELPEVDAELDRTSSTIASLKSAVLDAEQKTNDQRKALVALQKRDDYVDGALQQIAVETRRLQEVLETTEEERKQAEASKDVLSHRLSPVGKSVSDRETHFRLHNGKIAHLPIERLVDRMTEQIKSRQRIVMKFRRYEGVVGPLDGFIMKYVVQRQALSPLQAMQYGQNSYRFSVSRWTIEPSDTYRGETVEQALKQGARFRQLVESAEPDSSVTIWLYPGDFENFAKLRELAHSMNLRVAARPLPEGTPVAGSPTGSQSTSQ